MPSTDGGVLLGGVIDFAASADGCRPVTDSYEISIRVPGAYPSELPIVHETGGRIPRDFHKLQGNALCLGSPFRLWLLSKKNLSLLNFIERMVVPYLYGFSLHEAGEALPFGELRHGTPGLVDDLGEMLGTSDSKSAAAYLQAVRRKKRIANKRLCPCGSGVSPWSLPSQEGELNEGSPSIVLHSPNHSFNIASEPGSEPYIMLSCWLHLTLHGEA